MVHRRRAPLAPRPDAHPIGRSPAALGPAATAVATVAAIAAVATVGVLAGCGGERDTAPLPPAAERGRTVAVEQGCTSCHSVDGSSRIGPTWLGLLGGQVTLDDGTVVPADDDYVRTAVRDPAAQRRPGAWIQMPTYRPSLLSDAELDDLLAYLRHLGVERTDASAPDVEPAASDPNLP